MKEPQTWVTLRQNEAVTLAYDPGGVVRAPTGRYLVTIRWTYATTHLPDDTEPFEYDLHEQDWDVDCVSRTTKQGDSRWYFRGERVRYAMGLGHEGAPTATLEVLCPLLSQK